MSTVGAIITKARGMIRDLPNSHYMVEDLSEQVDGVSLTYQVNNRNILGTADGAPKDPVFLVSGAAQTVTLSASDKDAGSFTLATAPELGKQLFARYYHLLHTDAEFLGYVQLAATFCGVVPTFSALTDDTGVNALYDPAMDEYCAAMACRALASLTHWYYQANSGNKSFNMTQISAKFLTQADAHEKAAAAARLDVQTRFSQNKAPASATAILVQRLDWGPRR